MWDKGVKAFSLAMSEMLLKSIENEALKKNFSAGGIF